ncbi:MAG: DDE-type integrase/transposase/recombinase [Planctomycetes bacterium]|nr:DDE-type integrase/transposase/recombinase [Planctomycetota bacterium]MCC7122107.1 transposase [Gammaproteobacteria bacterium]
MPNPFEIAAFRFEQIAPFVDSSIDPSKRRDLMRRRVAVALPGGKKRRIPRSTMHRWINLYQQHGIRGLMPKSRADQGKPKTDSRDVIDHAIGLLLEQPDRSLQQLDVYIRSDFADFDLSTATLRRHLIAHPAWPVIERLRTGKDRRLRDRYEARHAHESWQLDGKGPFTVRLVSGHAVRAHVLTVLDDHSRAVLAAHVAQSEDTVAAIAAFAKAAARYGLPDRMQFDRGSAFDSKAFRDGIAHCGVHRNYVRARHPEAQGKIEAYHRSLQRWFLDELRSQEVHDLVHLQDLLEATIALVYQQHKHRSIGMSPETRLAGALSERRITEAELARAFFVSANATSDRKTGEVLLPNGRFRVPIAFAGRKASFRYDPIRAGAVVITADRREVALEPFVIKPLPDATARPRGNGRLQRLLDTWRGTARSNAEPAFGIPEVFKALGEVLARPMPASETDARDVQDFWRQHGPLSRTAFLRACQRAAQSLGEQRPLAVLLADIARQIHDDQGDGAAAPEVLA